MTVRLSADTLDILELGDAFRRGVGAMPDAMAQDVRKFMAMATWIYPEYPNMPENQRVYRQLEGVMAQMAEQHIDAGWPGVTVILPIAASSPIGRMIKANAQMQHGNVTFKLQTGRYDAAPELAEHPVRAELDAISPFASGIRGLANIGRAVRLG